MISNKKGGSKEMARGMLDPAEIEEKVRRGYLDRLEERVRRMRKFFAERNWPELRQECMKLQVSAETFGFSELAEIARQVAIIVPPESLKAAPIVPEIRRATSELFSSIDRILINETII